MNFKDVYNDFHSSPFPLLRKNKESTYVAFTAQEEMAFEGAGAGGAATALDGAGEATGAGFELRGTEAF